MASSAPLDPSAASFTATTAVGGGGHLIPLAPLTLSAPQAVVGGQIMAFVPPSLPPPPCLPHQLYAHPPHFSSVVVYAPPPVPCYVLSDSLYSYYPLPSPVAPSDQMVFDEIHPRMREPARKPLKVGATQKIWVRKNGAADRKLPATAVIREAETKLQGRTTLMIRNIPNQLRRRNLEDVLDHHCKLENKKGRSQGGVLKTAYNFLYLPMDFVFNLNLGYAFVNFTSAEAAARFYVNFNNLEWSYEDKRKICAICPAVSQGIDAMKKRYERSVFECGRQDYLPVVYSPPRDGSILSRRTILGRCTGKRPARRDGIMVRTWRKAACC